MKFKQEIEEIKNKDITKSTKEELINYKNQLIQKSNSAEKTQKVRLLKIINNVVGYILGLCIGLCIGKLLISYIYSGQFVGVVKYLGIACACFVPIIALYILLKIAQNNAKTLNQTCNQKITEIDRQIAVIDFKNELKASSQTNPQEADETKN